MRYNQIHYLSHPIFQRQDYKYNTLLKKKAFLHWFASNGLEEAVFDEAKEDLASLERDYK